MRIGSPPAAVALFIALGVIACASHVSAQATPACSSLTGTKIYGIGGSAQTPLIGQFASRLRESATDPVTIIYAEPGACYAIAAFDPAKSEADRRITTVSPATTARYWLAGNATAQNCTLDAGQLADFGSMQQYAEFCPDGELHDGLGDFVGPIGTVNVIVPADSSQSSISSEALYFLLKFGDAAGVEPWKQDYIIHRNGTSAVQLQLLHAAGLLDESPEIAFGWDSKSNSVTVTTVANGGIHAADNTVDPVVPAITVADIEATIGVVSGENAEANRDKVRTLAYQHVDQECSYWPDSSSTASDKLNVRTGRYYLWSALHLFAPVSGDDSVVADIEDPNVKKLVGYFTGVTAPPTELPVLDVFIDNYNIPQCAMQVSRDEDFGAISSFQPDEPCGCYYDYRATGRSDCEECEEESDCPNDSDVCRFGFCEVQ